MAHRLPPAGVKSEESEHFAFCQVLPKRPPPKRDPACEELNRPGACLLRPKFVSLGGDGAGEGFRAGGQQCCDQDGAGGQQLHLRCCCEEVGSPRRDRSQRSPVACPPAITFTTPTATHGRAAPPAVKCRGARGRTIIVLQGDTEQATVAPEKTPKGCHQNMRLQQVPYRDFSSDSQPTPKLIEFVQGPFATGGDGCDVLTTNRNPQDVKAGSMMANCGSDHYDFYRERKAPTQRVCLNVCPRDCRPVCKDFRRKKT